MKQGKKFIALFPPVSELSLSLLFLCMDPFCSFRVLCLLLLPCHLVSPVFHYKPIDLTQNLGLIALAMRCLLIPHLLSAHFTCPSVLVFHQTSMFTMDAIELDVLGSSHFGLLLALHVAHRR